MIRIGNRVVSIDNYPDGTLLFKDMDDYKGERIEWYYESISELVPVMYLARYFWDRRRIPGLYMPYIPDARMDRVKSDSEVFTLKYLAQTINTLHFSKIEVLDPHSDVSAALFNNVTVHSPRKYIIESINRIDSENLVLFYPDAGSAKRYSSLIRMPYSYGVKNRDWCSGKILDLNIADNGIDLQGKDILIVDDICSKGGTFYYSAKVLKELGVNNIYLYVTHCENSILNGTFGESGLNLLDVGLIEKVYTTNSIFTKEHSIIEKFDIRR